jgi:4-amino-4-deoxy-L-arabinose transferase-like glycosyltransferase
MSNRANHGSARGDRRAIFSLIVVSLALRIMLIALVPSRLWFAGGDGPWYVRQGWFLAHGGPPEPLRTVGPLYPVVLAAVWKAFPDHGDPTDPNSVAIPFLTSVHVFQVLLGTLTVVLVFRLIRRLLIARRAAWLAAAALAIGPAFVIEPVLLHTETLFITLLVATVLLRVRNSSIDPVASALTGCVAALAALARPVLLLFPFVLAAQIVLSNRSKRAVRAALTMMVGAALTLAPWHIWLHRNTGSWLPAGFASNLWIGTQRDGGPLEVTTFHELEDELEASGRGYLGGALHRIALEPGQWLMRRAANLTVAVLQPHGTSDLGGASTKEALRRWSREDRSLRGLVRVASSWTFWVRVSVYFFHYAALLLAAAGVWATLSDWRRWSPIYATALYFLLVHALLPASPRYLFPLEPFLWVLGSAAIEATIVTDAAASR